MALQLGALRDALIEAKVSPEKAAAAAEEVRATRTGLSASRRTLRPWVVSLCQLDGRMSALEGRKAMLTWAVGLNVAITLAVLAKLLVQP